VPGPPLLQLPSTLSSPVFILPPLSCLTEMLSIVKRAVFDGVKATRPVAFMPVATRTVYVPFADITSVLTHPIDGVTVPAVRLDIVKVKTYSRCECIPTFCDSAQVQLEL